MKNKRTTLFHSIIALLLCVSMLIGTTFAWFTDSVSTGINTIAAGNLDVELYHSNAAVTDEKVDSNTDLFMDLQGDPILWEPGVVSFENLRVSNEGDLALVYQLAINTANENFIVDPSGAQYGLSQILKVGVVEGGITATDRAGVVASVETANWTTLANFLRSGSLLPEGNGESEKTWGVVIYWEPGDNDNLWNLNNGKQLNEGDVLNIDCGIKLIATQETNEFDSFNNGYDNNAKAEFFAGFQGGSGSAVVTADDQGATTAEVAMNGGDVSAVIPVGVQVEDGANALTLSVTLKDNSEANIQLSESEEMRPLDVHIEGVAQGNTVPMLVTLKHYLSTGINTGALRLYHVENGTPVAMTQVATPVNHNEFSYDPATGDVTLALASFSEVAVVADTNNPWDGKTINTLWYDASATELTIYNADQLAGFAAIVDGKAEGIAQDSFEDKTVKLANNITLSGKNFDPIGWGYEKKDWNVGDVAGKPFKGTFDGNGKIIFNLYQNGWELEAENGTDYTYTNCGFGLFAAASDATFKNLIISGADIKVECVEAGILVGLSQNDCTYDNIKIYNSKIANYQRPAGGLIGEVSGDGATTITNVTIGSDVVVGSLWGDFDTPVGGVIGARWDDVGADPQIEMSYVDVGCRLDVYNDVTAAYQWHAYRRDGMLIGNTDTPAANGKTAQTATAEFLKCHKNENNEETVIVRLGPWANYHYCRFTNQDTAKGNNYPWVRVEAGENNPAFSNVRYGHPVVNGAEVVDNDHDCDDGYHNTLIAFAQLYGGGQGVYGKPTHEGVKVENYLYSIIYVNNDEVLSIQYVTEDMVNKPNPFIPNDPIAKEAAMAWVKTQGYSNVVFDCWVTAGSKKAEIPATNTENVTVYPAFTTPYTARFVDLDGNVLEWCFFNKDKSDIAATEIKAKELLPPQDENIVKFSNWEVHYYNDNGEVVTETYNASKFTGDNCYKTDVTIYPVYTYNGKLNLEPVDSDGDGKTNYYRVVATAELDENTTIPGNILGIPVKEVNKMYKNEGNWDFGSGVKTVTIQEGVEVLAHNSLGYTSALNTVYLPNTLKELGKNVFSRNTIGDWKKLTIVFNGTIAEWNAVKKHEDWANGLQKVSYVKCTDGEIRLEDSGFMGLGSAWKEYYY